MAFGRRRKTGSGYLSFCFAVLAILAFRWLFFEPFVIPSGSMIPTLLIHDHILVNKMAYGIRYPFTKKWMVKFSDPQRGDIVVFRAVHDGGYFLIKRIVGLPGDTVALNDEGLLTINGKPVDTKPLDISADPETQAPFYPVTEHDLGAPFDTFKFYEEKLGTHDHRMMLYRDSPRIWDHPFKVAPDSYFCMGDNRDNSKDSRYWGNMPRANLLGKALFVWLSCDDTLPLIPFVCNPLKIRWNRFFHVLE